MKQYKILSLMAIALTMIILDSCSNSTSSTPVTSGSGMSAYFPSAKGTWWITNTYDTDTLGNQLTLTATDSLYNAGNQLIDTKNAIIQITQHLMNSGQPADTSYFYTSGNVLYNYTSENPLDSKTASKWLAVIDLSKSSWTIFTLDSVMNINGFNFNVKATFTGKKTLENGTISLFGKTWNTKEVMMTMNMTMTGEILGLGTITVIQKMEVTMTLANNLGLAKTVTYTTSIDPQSGYSKTGSTMIVTNYSGK